MCRYAMCNTVQQFQKCNVTNSILTDLLVENCSLAVFTGVKISAAMPAASSIQLHEADAVYFVGSELLACQQNGYPVLDLHQSHVAIETTYIGWYAGNICTQTPVLAQSAHLNNITLAGPILPTNSTASCQSVVSNTIAAALPVHTRLAIDGDANVWQPWPLVAAVSSVSFSSDEAIFIYTNTFVNNTALPVARSRVTRMVVYQEDVTEQPPHSFPWLTLALDYGYYTRNATEESLNLPRSVHTQLVEEFRDQDVGFAFQLTLLNGDIILTHQYEWGIDTYPFSWETENKSVCSSSWSHLSAKCWQEEKRSDCMALAPELEYMVSVDNITCSPISPVWMAATAKTATETTAYFKAIAKCRAGRTLPFSYPYRCTQIPREIKMVMRSSAGYRMRELPPFFYVYDGLFATPLFANMNLPLATTGHDLQLHLKHSSTVSIPQLTRVGSLHLTARYTTFPALVKVGNLTVFDSILPQHDSLSHVGFANFTKVKKYETDRTPAFLPSLQVAGAVSLSQSEFLSMQAPDLQSLQVGASLRIVANPVLKGVNFSMHNLTKLDQLEVSSNAKLTALVLDSPRLDCLGVLNVTNNTLLGELRVAAVHIDTIWVEGKALEKITLPPLDEARFVHVAASFDVRISLAYTSLPPRVLQGVLELVNLRAVRLFVTLETAVTVRLHACHLDPRSFEKLTQVRELVMENDTIPSTFSSLRRADTIIFQHAFWAPYDLLPSLQSVDRIVITSPEQLNDNVTQVSFASLEQLGSLTIRNVSWLFGFNNRKLTTISLLNVESNISVDWKAFQYVRAVDQLALAMPTEADCYNIFPRPPTIGICLPVSGAVDCCLLWMPPTSSPQASTSKPPAVAIITPLVIILVLVAFIFQL